MLGDHSSPDHSVPFLSKLFAGIAAFIVHVNAELNYSRYDTILQQNETGDFIITGVSSKSGEIIQFEDPVVITPKQTKLQSWLSDVEHQMRFTLAAILVHAPDRVYLNAYG